MATAVFARNENSVSNDIDDPNDDVFSSNASNHPAPPSAAGEPNIPRTKKKPALPSAPKAANISRYLSCNGDVQVNGQHDAALGSSNIMAVDHFQVLQRTLRACRESLDRIDRFRNQSDRKRRLAYAARAFGLTTKPPPLVTSHHLDSDVTAVENRCAVDNSNTCSPTISGADTCSIRGPEAVWPPSWCTTLSASSSSSSSSPPIRPAASPYHPPTTGASLSTSPPTTSPATPTDQLDSLMMMTPVRSDTGAETDPPLSSPNHARPCSPPPPPPPPSNRNGAFPSSSSVYAAPTAPSTNQPPSTHPPSSSSTPTCPPCAPSSSSSTTTHSVPSQQQPWSQSAAGHVPRPPSSASSTPSSSSAPSHPLPLLLLYKDEGQKKARSRPSGRLSGPRERSHSDGGGGGSWENGGVMQQAEVEEITVEFEEAVGMADLVESAVDEVATTVDDDEDEDSGQVEGTTETGGFEQEGTWPGCSSQVVVNGLFSITEEDQTVSINDGELRERSGKDGWGTQGQSNSEGFYGSSSLEKITNFDSSWPEDADELISYRLSGATEDENDYTPRSLSQRPRTCLYRGRRTRMEREAKFGGKLRVRFADDVGEERDGDLGKDSSERRKRICATSDHKEEHPLDWLQADALDRRMNLIEENVLYIQDSLDRLLRSDDPKLGRYDVIDSGCESREAETSTRDDPTSSQYSHHHYHHYHHLSRSIIVVFVMCMIFILCILLLLPVAIRTVSIAYIPGQSVF